MKRVKIILPLLLVASAITACGASSSKAEDTNDTNKRDSAIESKKVDKTYTISLTKEEFLKKVVDYRSNPDEWLYIGDKPAIVDFWAEWCVYCRKLAPVLEELAKEYEGQIYIYKVNTEQEKEIASTFGIRSLPTLLFAPIGDTPQVIQGAAPKAELKKIIDEVLLKKSK